MTELEVMMHAKNYIDKMANGIDPLTNQPVKDDDLINNVRISRCLFYVSGVLDKVIAGGGTTAPARSPRFKKADFSLSQEQLGAFAYSEHPIPVKELTARLNALRSDENMKLITYKTITDWLLAQGFLEEYINNQDRTSRRPTAEGNGIGITLEKREGLSGVFYVTLYDVNAQHFVIDHLDAILGK